MNTDRNGKVTSDTRRIIRVGPIQNILKNCTVREHYRATVLAKAPATDAGTSIHCRQKKKPS